MEFVNKMREKPAVKKIEKFAPAIAFLGGFLWDSITLGRMVYGIDIVILLAYYTGALILVTLLSARLEHPEGWTAERLQALQKAQAKPQATPSPVSSKDSPAPKQAESRFAKAAQEAKDAATKAKDAASKFAKNVGYESTAIPENAIIIHHRFLDREWSDTWKKRFTWALQFCFGGLFSALVVCYFKSSGSIASFLLVIMLAILLVGNEFLQKKYESFGITLAFFCLLGTMFLNFAIPHLVHSIGFIWFLLSTLLSLGLCMLIWKLSRRQKGILVAPAIISILLIVAYIMNWVPPVPLVLKQKIACQNFDKVTYTCDIDDPSFLQILGLKIPSVHRVDSNDIYFLASVYAPADLKAELEYLWYYQDTATGKYKLTDKISSGRMTLNGGRESGFRSYTRKKNIPPGKYRVEVAKKNGAVIGSGTFEVFDSAPQDGFVRDTLR
ncbi:DUF2914 domain-containing protein [uncultured Fibrobacter sp.]|uniref:DUF2914 domain-containing protein n=1 Tax=uncultured Fibrobacter sp. TaxID=261512 RepID=UPI002626D32D|nr:DUF2914 domain-containing protein [uncultured Fibrobacter sp.]